MTVVDVFAFVPAPVLATLHWLSGWVVLSEALNKLERSSVFERGACLRRRLVVLLKVLGWMLLALGAVVAVAGPVLGLPGPNLGDAAVMLGFALLIVRTRVREGVLK
jgi:hypothetical protein